MSEININNILKIKNKSDKLNFIWFILISAFFLAVNFLSIYYLQENLYLRIIFISSLFFIFKAFGLNFFYILLYGVMNLFLTLVISLLKDELLVFKLYQGLSVYIIPLFILTFISYIYENKIEKKIRLKLRAITIKRLYLYLSYCFVFLFLFFSVFFNLTYFKVLYFNKFNTKEYFNLEKISIGWQNIQNKMKLYIEEPADYEIINGKFKLSGWTIDESSISDAHIDYICVYYNNLPKNGGYFISSCEYGIERKDLMSQKGEKYRNTGFLCELDSKKFNDGLKDLYICYHSNIFGWKFEKLKLFINNKGTFLFEDILNIFNRGKSKLDMNYVSLYPSEKELIIEEGENTLKYIKVPIKIESNNDYLISFKIKSISMKDADNNVYIDFFGDDYDNNQQEFFVNYSDLSTKYKKINQVINSGNVPKDNYIFFRIFTYNSGSLKIEDLAVYKIITKR